MEPVVTARWIKEWPAFEAALKDKLDHGYREYGDGSFQKSPFDLLRELQAEALDLAGWGFMLWVRINTLVKERE